MKAKIKNIARRMATWPAIGPLVRIAADIIRIRHLRAAYLDLNHRQHLFETQQLPTILSSISDINSRVLINTADQDNLVKSAPIALRKITRDMSDIRGELKAMQSSKHEIEEINRILSDAKNLLENRLADEKNKIEQTKQSVENLSGSVNYLLGRVEFVRRELMFEMRYGASTYSTENAQLKTKTEILSPEKLAAARDHEIRLNLGCGHIPIEGYLNVDRRALPGVNIVAEVDDLPFEEGEVDEIFSAHLLEHFPQEQLRRELLPYFFKLIKKGGKFHAIVPDGQAMTIQAAKDPDYFENFRLVTYGAQDYDGDFHFNMFSPETLTALLQEAGFEKIQIIERGRRNDICYEFEIVSFK
jgi:predicted SAM-dependent methyltransferase